MRFGFVRKFASVVAAVAAALTLITTPVQTVVAATADQGSKGYIANYGGNTINLIDPVDGESYVYDQNPEYDASFFDVTADGQNFMSMFQRYDGANHYYHNTLLEIYSPQKNQVVQFDLDNSYYNTMSPDGSKISFYEIDDNYMTIYDISTDSFSRMQFPSYLYPVWSPDSTKMAYYRYDWNDTSTGAYGAYTDLRTGAHHHLPSLGKPLAWSPDGTKIAFTSAWGQFGISIYDIATGSVSVLNPGNKLDMLHQASNFVWSPDMQEIAFTVCDSAANTCAISVGSPHGTAFRTYPGANVYGTQIKWVPPATATTPSPAPATHPVYRLANWKTHERLFTTDYNEALYAVRHYEGWVLEGISFHVSNDPSNIPVYRMANWKTHERLFTTDYNEALHAVRHYEGWVLEGIAFYVSPNTAGNIPVYRMANWKTHERLFTTDLNEAHYAVQHYQGWVLEGISFYVRP